MRTISDIDTLVDGLTVRNTSDGKMMFVVINRSQNTQRVSLKAGTWAPSADQILKRVISSAGYAETTISLANTISTNTFSTANSVTVFIATIPSGARKEQNQPKKMLRLPATLSCPYILTPHRGSFTSELTTQRKRYG